MGGGKEGEGFDEDVGCGFVAGKVGVELVPGIDFRVSMVDDACLAKRAV